MICRYKPTPESSEAATEDVCLVLEVAEIAARGEVLPWERRRGRGLFTGVRVFESQAGLVTVAFIECVSSDNGPRRVTGVATVLRLAGRAAPLGIEFSPDMSREPNLALADDSRP